MARPQVADAGKAPIWRVAANILKKQSRTADTGWSSSLWVGRGANTLLTVKTSSSYETFTKLVTIYNWYIIKMLLSANCKLVSPSCKYETCAQCSDILYSYNIRRTVTDSYEFTTDLRHTKPVYITLLYLPDCLH